MSADKVGKVVRIRGHRGRFVIHAIHDGVVDCYGGTEGRRRWRCFPADLIGAVDREATRRRDAEKADA